MAPKEADEGNPEGGFPVGVLSGIVEKLLNLDSLYLTGEGEESNSWAAFRTDTQFALLKVARYAPITTIEFEEVNRWPVGFLRHCTHLRHLKIRALCDPFLASNATLDEPTEPFHVGVRLKLESLQLKTSTSPTLLAYIGTSHPTLRTLAFNCQMTSDTAKFLELLHSCTKSLERLIIIHNDAVGK